MQQTKGLLCTMIYGHFGLNKLRRDFRKLNSQMLNHVAAAPCVDLVDTDGSIKHIICIFVA